MNAVLLALSLALAVQNPSPSPERPPPLPSEPVPPGGPSPAHDVFYEDFRMAPDEARIAIQRFGACVADRRPERAADVLARDFTMRPYRIGLRQLVRSNDDCFRRRARMRSYNLLIAGAIAEELIERDSEALNVRLARAALRPATPSYSLSDRVAICVVRSVPDDVARLLATEVTTEAETAAARALDPVVARCNASGRPIGIRPADLRSVLASAALRQLRTAAPAGEEAAE